VPSQSIPTFGEYQSQQSGLVTIWFDDAYKSQFDIGYPILKEKGLTAAIAVPTAHVGYPAYMTWSQLTELQNAGWETTAHSRNHNCRQEMLAIDDLENEILGSADDLLRHGLAYYHYVSPCGTSNETQDYIASMHFQSQRIAQEGLNALPLDDEFHLKTYTLTNKTVPSQVESWLREAKKGQDWIILSVHQIGQEEGSYTINEGMLREVIEKVAASRLPVVLPSQVIPLNPKEQDV
jgi:hypothetical protein